MMSSLFQREGEGSSGGGGQEGGGERGVVSGPARLEEEAHPTTEQDIASGKIRDTANTRTLFYTCIYFVYYFY